MTVRINPNPFTGRILTSITLSKPQKITISIADITGRLVKTYSANLSIGESQVEMNMESKPAGMYFIKVAGKENSITTKLVKIR
jgi:hypothetical protein